MCKPGTQEWLVRFEGITAEGWEKSFKLSLSGLQTERMMVGVLPSHLSREKLDDLLTGMRMADDARDSFHDALPDANLILFGHDQDRNGQIFKVYLEYWDIRRQEARASSPTYAPRLLHLGYKWRPSSPDQVIVARYLWHPGLPAQRIVRRIERIYEDVPTRRGLGIVKEIFSRAYRRAETAAFTYLEVEEEGNPRRSFDLNFYESGLRLTDVDDVLEEACRHYDQPVNPLLDFLAEVKECLLGHVAGGVGRDGADFLTVYYEV